MLEAQVLFREYVVAQVCDTPYTRQERYAACEALLEASLYYGLNYCKTQRKVQLGEARVKIYKSWGKRIFNSKPLECSFAESVSLLKRRLAATK